MRLTCPNCSTSYEVGDDAIPESGRKVQCSNCNEVWFQASALAAVEAETATEDPAPTFVSRREGMGEPFDRDLAQELAAEPVAPEPPSEFSPEADPVDYAAAETDEQAAAEESSIKGFATPEPDPVTDPGAVADAVTEVAEEAAALADATVADTAPLDDEILGAEIESAIEQVDVELAQSEGEPEIAAEPDVEQSGQSKADPDVAETQEESESSAGAIAGAAAVAGAVGAAATPRIKSYSEVLGDTAERARDLTELDNEALTRSLRDQIAQAEEEQDAQDDVRTRLEPASRRGKLPDANELNSSLREHREERSPEEQKKSGFLTGFMIAILLGFLAIAVYIFAPQLSLAIPALADPLASYVAFVNDIRAKVAGVFQ